MQAKKMQAKKLQENEFLGLFQNGEVINFAEIVCSRLFVPPAAENGTVEYGENRPHGSQQNPDYRLREKVRPQKCSAVSNKTQLFKCFEATKPVFRVFPY